MGITYVCLLKRAHVVGAVATHEAEQPTVLQTTTNSVKTDSLQ